MMRSEHHTGMHSFHNILISKSALVFLEQLQGRIPFLISHCIHCHTPSWLDPGEPSHMCIHLTTDRDSTQLNTPPCCRQDISLVSNTSIGTGFGPQNITVIMSQESHHQHAFLIRIAETIFHMCSKLRHNYAIKCIYFL